MGVEAYVAAGRTYASASSAPRASGIAGPPAAQPLRLAVLGDSTAAGLGVATPEETVGGRLASSLVERRVTWTGYGVAGARAADLAPQVTRALRDPRADIALILIGANDAVHLSSVSEVGRELGAAVARLRARGTNVIVATCPDMGAARAFMQPLRTVVAFEGNRIARAEGESARAAGAVTVDLARETGHAFRTDARNLSADGFHPSALGYDLWARAIRTALPSQWLQR